MRGRWSLCGLLFNSMKHGHGRCKGIGRSVYHPCSYFALLGIVLARCAKVVAGLIGQPVDSDIAKPEVMHITFFGLLFGQVSLDFDSMETVDMGMFEVPRIFGPVVIGVPGIVEGLDHGLAVNDDIGPWCLHMGISIGRGKGTGREVEGEEFSRDSGHMPVSRDPSLDDTLFPLGINLEDSGPCLGDLWELHVHGRAIRVYGQTCFEMEGAPVLYKTIKVASDAARRVVRLRARDWQGRQGNQKRWLISCSSFYSYGEGARKRKMGCISVFKVSLIDSLINCILRPVTFL